MLLCDEIGLSLTELFRMSFRDGVVNGSPVKVLATVEVEVTEETTPYTTCTETNEPIQSILRGLFDKEAPGCWRVRVLKTAGDFCNHELECEPMLSEMDLLLGSVRMGVDGFPVLAILSDETLSIEPLSCDIAESGSISLFRSLFASFSGYSMLKVLQPDSAEACGSDCNELTTTETIFRSAIGNNGGCNGFFFDNTVVTPVCNLDDVDASLVFGGSGGIRILVLAQSVPAEMIGELYTVVFMQRVTELDAWGALAASEFTNMSVDVEADSAFFYVSIECNGSTSEFYFARKAIVNFLQYMSYRVNSGAYYKAETDTTITVAEGDTLTVRSSDTSVLVSYAKQNPVIVYPGGSPKTFTISSGIGSAPNDYKFELKCELTFNGYTGQQYINAQWVAIPVISGSAFFCVGGLTELTASFGTSSIDYDTYQWKRNGINIGGATSKTYNATLAGSYTCVGTFNGVGTVSAAHVLTEAAAPQPILSIGDTMVCSNNPGFNLYCTDAGVYSGGYPAGTTFEFVGYTPQITDNFMYVDATGSYTCIVTLPAENGGCSAQSDASVIDFGTIQSPQLSLTPTPATVGMSNGSASVEITFGGTANYRYQWYSYPDNILLRDVTNALTLDTLAAVPAGQYYVTVTDHQGVGIPPYCSDSGFVEIVEI